MAIILAVVFIWLIIALLITAPKGMNLLETLFVFILVIIADQIYCSYIQVNLNWIEAYETITAKVVLNLQRTIIVPLLTLLMINLHVISRRVWYQIIHFLIFYILILLLEMLCAYYEILMYKQYQTLIPIFHSIILYGVGLISFFVYRSILKMDVNNL